MNTGLTIAMWSGPRNISTALMRSFESRGDCHVTDEPFYAYFLNESGENHPAREEILKSQSSDWNNISNELTAQIPRKKIMWYQKHMAHHIFPYSDLSWIHNISNCFLIRDPKEVINSYIKRFKLVDHKQLGYNQQLMIFNKIKKESDEYPIVLSAKDVLTDPEKMLRKLCEKLDIRFNKRMLNWPSGKRDTDGIWAPHWYSEVEKTTGFQPYSYGDTTLEDNWKKLYNQCMDDYEALYKHRLT